MSDITCIDHCCLIHGCKYSHSNCVVANGVEPQAFVCETCWEALGIRRVEQVKAYDLGKLKTCPHCRHIL